ncbi:MAG: AAA family ATPase, partial [Lachnospiraceae bacterium]|nr:AAA family ATPase [Lachnospiraceae bacterium]
MGRYLNLGNDGFQAIRKGHYIDKTGMLSFINSTLGTMDKLTCVSRPRRFGKSYAAKMLCAYYDKSCDSHNLFEDLEIAKDSSFEIHLNKYNVIYLDITLFIAGAGDVKNVITDLQTKVIT